MTYSVGFIIPTGASRVLSDDGWEFGSQSRLPSYLEKVLQREYSLHESYLGCTVYVGDDIKIDVLKDNYGAIEQIYFRYYNGLEPELPAFFHSYADSERWEYFVP